MKAWLCVMVLFGNALACMALESGDLLFHLSFENGVTPELARGCAQPATMPTELDRRLVDGLVIKNVRLAKGRVTLDTGPFVRGVKFEMD